MFGGYGASRDAGSSLTYRMLGVRQPTRMFRRYRPSGTMRIWYSTDLLGDPRPEGMFRRYRASRDAGLT